MQFKRYDIYNRTNDNLGGWEAKVFRYAAVTRDKSLSAQAEHTLMVVEDGCKIFTESLRAKMPPTTITKIL